METLSIPVPLSTHRKRTLPPPQPPDPEGLTSGPLNLVLTSVGDEKHHSIFNRISSSYTKRLNGKSLLQRFIGMKSLVEMIPISASDQEIGKQQHSRSLFVWVQNFLVRVTKTK